MLHDTIKIKNKVVKIYDEGDFSMDPREWDNLGTMAFFHKRYQLGDKHNFSPDELLEFIDEENPIRLPVYMYDHSGIAISTHRTGQFADPWDSGMLGYIFVERDKVKSEYNWKVLTKERIAKIESYLQCELDVYNLFLQGRVYYFHSTCERCGNEDSCGGFYGEDWKENGLVDQADYYCQCEERAWHNAIALQE